MGFIVRELSCECMNNSALSSSTVARWSSAPVIADKKMQTTQDVYVGGWREARAKAQANIDSAESLPEFSMYSGSCGWGPGQLQREEELGAWWVVSASPGCIRELLRGEQHCSRLRFMAPSTSCAAAALVSHWKGWDDVPDVGWSLCRQQI